MVTPEQAQPYGGALAAALAKAQGEFPGIARDKEVTVQTKTGGSYKFKYAPLDSILNAVRKPLAENGLAITQLLDSGDLVTMLLHKDGASLSGRTSLPVLDGNVQAFGSAITYLRRYSIQAILGIAAEEDDDGNQAAGNTATFSARPSARFAPDAKPVSNAPGTDPGGLIGYVGVAKDSPDFLPHQGPDGPVLTFRLTSEKGGIKVIATGALASALSIFKEDYIGSRVTCWGQIRDETFTPKGAKKPVTYQVLDLERIAPEPPDVPATPAEADEPPLEEPPDEVVLTGEQPTLLAS